MGSLAASDLAARIPTVADVEAAAKRIAGQAVRTPLLESPALNERVGGRVLIKAEPCSAPAPSSSAAPTTALASSTAEQRTRGVVAYLLRQPRPGRGRRGADARHAGDHRDAGRRAGDQGRATPAPTAPRSCPTTATREDREAIARSDRRGARRRHRPALRRSRHHRRPGHRRARDRRAGAGLGATLDAVLVPCGGGGLIAGIALAIAATLAGRRRLRRRARRLRRPRALARERQAARPTPAARARSATPCSSATPGEITFAINRRLLTGGLVVDRRRGARGRWPSPSTS